MNRTKAEKIDAVLAHRIWGFPVFLGIVFLIFYFTFVLGKYKIRNTIPRNTGNPQILCASTASIFSAFVLFMDSKSRS